MQHIKIFAWLWLALSWVGQAMADSTHVDAELSVRHDNNVSRAESGQDVFSDTAAGLDLNIAHSMMLTAHSGLQLHGGLHLTQFARFEDLNHVGLQAGVLYRIQPVKAYTAPWFDVSANWQRQTFQNSDIREGDLLSLELGAGQRLTDRLRLRAGYGWERRFADDNEVFEWRRRTARIGADFKISTALTLYGTVSRTRGDQVFTATPAPAFLTAAKDIVDDPVFGARRAYRLGAQADLLELGGSYSLNSSHTLDVGLRRFNIEADAGHSYEGTEVRASWLYRFQ
jgi:hypothetical protein